MINQTILYLPHKDCHNARLKPYASEVGMNVNWDPDLHLGKPLSKLFSKVIRFDVGESYIEYGVMQTNQKIIELVKEHSPKYVIWPTMTYEIFEETFQEIREFGSYVVGWFFDDETRFDDYSRWWISYMDYFLTADKSSIISYQKLGAKAYYLPVTCEPEDFNVAHAEAIYDISFVGSKNVADRESLVERFFDDGILINTFGKGWTNGFVSHEEMVKIFNTSKINICFTKASDERKQLKGKIFDITMCGGFLLCEYVEGIEDFFEIGKEIICFNDYDDAVKKINYYLKNDEERERIAQAGKIRATKELAQHKLLEKVFTTIEMDIEATVERTFISVPILQMPLSIRVSHAQYHLRWATVLKKIGFVKKIWQAEYKIAYKYVSFFSLLKYKNRLRIQSLIERVKKI